MSESPEDKYMVDVVEAPKAIPAPKESLEAIKGAVKGKALAKMKKEAVDCPVKRREYHSLNVLLAPTSIDGSEAKSVAQASL